MTKTLNLNSNCIRVVLPGGVSGSGSCIGPDISPLTIDLTEGGGVRGTESGLSC